MTDLELLQLLADRADEISLARFRSQDLKVESKPDRTPVTDADQSVERAIRELIAEHRPEDSVIGEEFGSGEASDREWIIDPIDGTANFLRGLPIWATLIALRVNGELVCSVVSAPAMARRWWAARGEGAWTRDVSGEIRGCKVSAVSRLEDAYFSYNSLGQWKQFGRIERIKALADKVWRIRAFGDFLSYMYVAEGLIEAASEPDLKLYDIAALVPIVREAGGSFSGLDGEITDETSAVIASNSILHDAFLSELS